MSPERIISITVEHLDLILETITKEDPGTPVVEVTRIIHQVLDLDRHETTYDISGWSLESQAWRISRERSIRQYYPDRKIHAIKQVRTSFSLNLLDAKTAYELAESRGYFLEPL